MNIAMYFLGVCLLGVASAVVWATLVVRKSITEFRAAVASVPEAVALAGKVVADANVVVKQVGNLVGDARGVIPGFADGQKAQDLWKGLGEGGAMALKGLSSGLFGADTTPKEGNHQS
ncbi:hypothetical protein G6L37_05885 [Agrobacterium rubi]|nr:hypothetical protein [Agrobacterium rubi]NTF24890.1 hypothetical protein [Agrobacterium rubi]